ncbi:DSBA oxidoreductase [Nocardioides baekrokdamisoli]|uniref:DSBA oxidoreductase n=1 Tax=Nocardioides baekrokdamisoli TaxID=1804624 RepID=A0A3G9J0I6_9ACTN|nr:DsbA family oxidoreductase [Nocardioides baekrokdamisoli]BBH18133.1 DSBA oxidoreductase [Nocardioides baekrokdamisoli]
MLLRLLRKRRLEKALATFPHEVEVVWRSYQLDPGSPKDAVDTVGDYLGRKYGGGPEAGRAMIDRVEAVAAEEGMIWRHSQSLRVNTLDAHRLLHAALADGGPKLQGDLKEALLKAYFVDTRNVADHGVLAEIAAEVGLDAGRIREVLGSVVYTDEVWNDQQTAASLGATGVPFYVIDRAYGIAGAESAEVFSNVLRQAWEASHPSLQMVQADDSCGPDGCVVPQR